MASLQDAIEAIKGNLVEAIPAEWIEGIVRELGLRVRERQLTPVLTTLLAIQRCLHGGTAITHLRHFTEVPFCPSAYCQAIERLPVAFFEILARLTAGRWRTDRIDDRWHGHRVVLIDGTGLTMPDTAALQAAFGQPSNQKPGCGFPVGHLLALFDHRTGYLLRTILAPLATHDLAHAAATHTELEPHDLLLGDRAFGSFAHLATLRKHRRHGLFRQHQRRPRSLAPDRHVAYAKPLKKPSWMSEAEYAELPSSQLVREVRVTVRSPRRRVRSITLVTTLLDRVKYPARVLAKLYEQRWAVEGHLRSLKVSLGMGTLKSQTVDGIKKDVLLFGIAYNLVRRAMQAAADRQGVPVDRVSFTDAMRSLFTTGPAHLILVLILHPHRPDRHEPRAVKARPKNYRRLTQPRARLKKALEKQHKVA
jgi:hypothetical protein